ncbi:hypothetical protein [Natronorubrum halophilum]|uniref:hypothetical protein n=1 Tax=Natronorubrum halophilum TaxID=1702106 RepID=UPI0014854F53|nr:hypothetical protein [Natronorubrum halophilum]
MEDAVPETKAEITQKNISKLIEDQRVIYDIITEHGEISPSDLYDQYILKSNLGDMSSFENGKLARPLNIREVVY